MVLLKLSKYECLKPLKSSYFTKESKSKFKKLYIEIMMVFKKYLEIKQNNLIKNYFLLHNKK